MMMAGSHPQYEKYRPLDVRAALNVSSAKRSRYLPPTTDIRVECYGHLTTAKLKGADPFRSAPLLMAAKSVVRPTTLA